MKFIINNVFVDNLFLNISTLCNMKCARCFGHLEGIGKPHLMDLETAQAATRLYFRQRKPDSTNPFIMLFGGEPLLNLDLLYQLIPWIQDEFRSDPFTLCLFTNGLALNDSLLDYFLSRCVHLFISLDGGYDIQLKNRPVTPSEHTHIVSMVKKAAAGNRELVTPYCVVQHEDIGRIHSIMSGIASLGVDRIAVTKNLEEWWAESDRVFLLDQLKKIRQELNVQILLYPEIISDCRTCDPGSMMVYPDGSIMDLCYTCSSVLSGNGIIAADDNQVMQLGHLGQQPELFLDVTKKREIVKTNMQCTISDPEDPKTMNSLATFVHPLSGFTA